MKTIKLKIDRIVADPSVQPRVTLHKPTVEEYAERYSHGDTFPPPVVYWDEAINWLSEGFHRFAAWKKADLSDEIEVERRPGSKEDAILNALASNWTHGLRRTNADKRRSVEMAVDLRPKWTDRRIADLVGVSHNFVNEVRRVLSSDDNTQEHREGKDGREYKSTKGKSDTEVNGQQVDSDSPVIITAAERKPESFQDRPRNPIAGDTWPAAAALTKGTKFWPKVMLLPTGSEAVYDAYGQPVPAGTGDYFNDATIRQLRDDGIALRTSFDGFLEKLNRAKSSRKAYPWTDQSGVSTALEKINAAFDDILALLGDSLPYLVCPDCHGRPVRCQSCRNTGYWPIRVCEENPARMPKVKRPTAEGIA